MNCKPGDLAIVVKSPSGRNYGKVVRCVKVVSPDEDIRIGDNIVLEKNKRSVVWELEEAKIEWEFWSIHTVTLGGVLLSRDRTSTFRILPYCSDENLMPIRPDELKDEEVQTCNVPVEVAR